MAVAPSKITAWIGAAALFPAEPETGRASPTYGPVAAATFVSM